MCGIVGGIARTEAQAASWRPRLDGALECLRLRGPDSRGRFDEGGAALAQTRLKIIDLSAAADQPMLDPTGRYVLAFNGEIFNYRELRAELDQAGVAFCTQSDTEVLLHWLIRTDTRALNRLNGFFAAALYDRHTGRLLLVRDRYGIKPLLIYRTADQLLFASELKALVALGISRRLDHASVVQFFELNYVPPNASIFEGVEKLAPGHWLSWQAGQVETGAYYRVQPRALHDPRPAPSYDAAVAGVLTHLERAVQLRLIADVPLGVFLSGGLDSSAVAALAVRHSPHIRSFSLSFDDPLYDETSYAEAVARHLGTDHTSIRVSHDTLLEHVEAMLDYLDEPFADASALNFYVLSKAVRPWVTVALSGDGADELFAGYHKHVGEAQARRPTLLNGLLRTTAPLLQALPASRNTAWGRRLVQAQRYSAALRLSPADRYWAWASVGTDVEALLALPTAAARARRASLLGDVTEAMGLNGVLAADFALVLGGDMLPKGDLMSMANSLEVRTPFLDYDLVDYVFGLPESYKLLPTRLGGQRKRVLNDAVRPLLPELIYHRPKQGFEVPLAGWFRTALRSRVEREVGDVEFLRHQGIFRLEGLRQLWQIVERGENRKEEWTLWAFLVFQQFYRRYVDTAAEPQSTALS